MKSTRLSNGKVRVFHPAMPYNLARHSDRKHGAGRLSDKLSQVIDFGGGKVAKGDIRYVTLHSNGTVTGILYHGKKGYRVRLKDSRWRLWTVDGAYNRPTKG